MNNTVFTYIVGASSNPDILTDSIPYEISSSQIFFGPCKKLLRENLYRCFLEALKSGKKYISRQNLYIIGLNAANRKKVRKIVWFGKIRTIYTFEAAFYSLHKQKVYKTEKWLLHFEPIYNNKGLFIGYKHISNVHFENDNWILDVIKKKTHSGVLHKGKELRLINPNNRKTIFVRDCCFTCDNLFYAKGQGIDIDEKILKLFKDAQPGKEKVDHYAIFGRKSNDSANGLQGTYLEIKGEIADRLINLLKKNAPSPKLKNNMSNEINKQCKKCL